MQKNWWHPFEYDKKNLKVLPLSEKMEVLHLIRKKGENYAEVKIYSKNILLSMILWRRKKKLVTVLLLHFKLQKLQPQRTVSA